MSETRNSEWSTLIKTLVTLAKELIQRKTEQKTKSGWLMKFLIWGKRDHKQDKLMVQNTKQWAKELETMMIGIRNKYSQTKVEWPNEYFAEMQRINILSKACIHIRRKQLSGKKRCAYQ